MGFVFCTSGCVACGKIFSYHPNLVPSIPMLNGEVDPAGQREPVCKECVAYANEIRVEKGLDPIVPHPLAYEGDDENNIDWTDNRTLIS